MRRLVVFSPCLVGAATVASAKDCSVGHYEFVFGSDSDATMVVESGKRCASTINGRSAVEESSIVQSPSHGNAVAVDTHHWSYQSQPNFTGTDAFVVAMTGTSYRKGRSGSVPLSGTTHLNVAVQIVP